MFNLLVSFSSLLILCLNGCFHSPWKSGSILCDIIIAPGYLLKQSLRLLESGESTKLPLCRAVLDRPFYVVQGNCSFIQIFRTFCWETAISSRYSVPFAWKLQFHPDIPYLLLGNCSFIQIFRTFCYVYSRKNNKKNKNDFSTSIPSLLPSLPLLPDKFQIQLSYTYLDTIDTQ